LLDCDGTAGISHGRQRAPLFDTYHLGGRSPSVRRADTIEAKLLMEVAVPPITP
jgi:hypothetical protein